MLNQSKLTIIRNLVLRGQIILSEHLVNDKILENEFTVDDVEESLLRGVIVKTQRDEKKQAYDGKKYTIEGCTRSGCVVVTVGKILKTEDGKLYFVITAF